MALIDDVKGICDRLAPLGWRALLRAASKNGLDISRATTAGLKAELVKNLAAIDRSLPGFEDFAPGGQRAVTAGEPALSLLYHALASPLVTRGPDGQLLQGFPSPAELDVLENFIFSLARPALPAFIRQHGGASKVAIAVFCSEYRPAADTVDGRHADLTFARTGIARVGTARPRYEAVARGFWPEDQDNAHGIRVIPARFSAWLAVKKKGRDTRVSPILDNDQAQARDEGQRDFWVPVHKVFGGPESCTWQSARGAVPSPRPPLLLRERRVDPGAGQTGGRRSVGPRTQRTMRSQLAAATGADARTDVLVIGGGPAGCAAALAARRAGLDVILIETERQPQPAPGETLHPGIEPILSRLGVWKEVSAAGFHRHRGIWKELNGGRSFHAYGEDENGAWWGLQADRQRFHGLLLKAVMDAGGEVRRPVSPLSVIQEESRVVGVLTSACTIRACWVLDATGRRAWLARRLALKEECHSPSLRIRFGWHGHEPAQLEGQPLFCQHAQGWDWQAPLGNGRSAWVTLRFARSGGADYSWRIYQAPAGPGYFLLGDAAALLDPAASSGVLRAMMSGMLAVDLIGGVLDGRIDRQPAYASYRRWIGDVFHHHARELRRHYSWED